MTKYLAIRRDANSVLRCAEFKGPEERKGVVGWYRALIARHPGAGFSFFVLDGEERVPYEIREFACLQ
ncbi:MAG TPA: hypothetical protein VJB16_02025 [archaeon]|nr:hypothetical protein [archaeon]